MASKIKDLARVVAATDVPQWHVVDAKGQVLGRLASRVATILQGKHKPIYEPSMDNGDYVVVVNASDIELTGKKMQKKLYRHHTGYMGHLREIPAEKMMEKKPEKVIELAVSGMLPKNQLRAARMKKLRVFAGPEHDHEAQVRGVQKALEDL